MELLQKKNTFLSKILVHKIIRFIFFLAKLIKKNQNFLSGN